MRPMAEPILATEGLTKRFGGLIAVNSVGMEFAPGRVHAIIGPNGAGKTTLINLLSGELQPTDGRIWFKGIDITGCAPDGISRLGCARSFQITNLYPSLSCIQNCWIAAQSRLPSSMRFFRPAHRLSEVRHRAEGALELCGLRPQRDSLASTLSHGERRRLEIAIALATEPELFLLDEPLAGVGSPEHEEVVALLKQLARDHTLILIEHDMDAVFAIADTLTVMVNGEVLADGTVEAVRANRAVQDAYLGHTDSRP
jgi:branched-chain amino acid transport system ATP-binding protein